MCNENCDGIEPAVCGDGEVTAPETCDAGGESATCNLDCSAASCGDGTLNTSAGEECDDGNLVDGDGCNTHILRNS